MKYAKTVDVLNAKPKPIGVKMINRNHPNDVGLTYLQHLKFAWNESKEAWWMSTELNQTQGLKALRSYMKTYHVVFQNVQLQ